MLLGFLFIKALEKRYAEKTPRQDDEEDFGNTGGSVVIKADDVISAIERRAWDAPLLQIVEEIAEALPYAGLERRRIQEALDRMAAAPGQPRIVRSGRYYGLRKWEEKYRQSIEHLALMRVALDHMVLRGIIAKPYYTRGEGMPGIIGREQGSIIRVECETGSKEYMPISDVPTGKSINLVLEAQLKLHRLFAEAPKATPRGKTAFNNAAWLVLREELYREFQEFMGSRDYTMWNMKSVFEEYYNRDFIVFSRSMLEASVAGS